MVVRKIEAFRGAPYDDAGAAGGGRWTYGFGSTRDPLGQPVGPGTAPISEAQAVLLLQRDMGGARDGVRRLVRTLLVTCQATALISWTYNLGEGHLATSTMLSCINEGRMDRVPSEMRQWINHLGKPSLGLLRRRWAEAAIFQGLDAASSIERAWAEIKGLQDWPEFGLAS
ncbi:MAG TPA: lysozyme [Rhodocyclaceae bacterium]|nr:lysozyme [Rhodocyclaceae bacterium]